jgi:uncharacterized membrane protein
MRKKISQSCWLFALIATVFGLLFIITTPPLWGIDESAHFARAYQIAHGGISPHHNMNNANDLALPKNLIDLEKYVTNDLTDDNTVSVPSRKDIDNANGYKQFTSEPFSKEEVSSRGVASYSPVAYGAPAVGIFVANRFNASIGQTIFSARLCSLILYIAIVWLSLWLLKNSKLRWLIFAIALLPICIFQASVVTADNAAIGLSILFAALFIRAVQEGDKERNNKIVYGLAAVALLLPLVKINYIFLSLGVTLIPNRLFKTNRLAIIFKVSVVMLANILGLAWSKIVNVTSASSISDRPDGARVVPADQIATMIHSPLHFIAVSARSVIHNGDSYFLSLTSLVGWNYVTVPLVFILLLCLGIFLAAVYAKNELVIIRKRLLVLSLFVLGGVVSIFIALFITFTPADAKVIDGIQGRYFIPFLVPVSMTLAAFVPFEVKIRDKLAPYIFGAISATCLTVSVAWYYLSVY